MDLGAAANFAKEEAAKSQHTRTGSSVSSDLLNDEFDPRAPERLDTDKPSEFGDFEAAFSGSQPQPPKDGFADFTSAFVPDQPTQVVF